MRHEQYLNHVTLNTAHTRKSFRDEVDDDVVKICAELLDDALSQPQIHAVIPRLNPKCTLTAAAEGSTLIATVWTPPVELRGSAPMRAPLVTIGVALRSKGGAKLWKLMHQTYPHLKTFGTERPGEPWVAGRIEVSANVLEKSEMLELMPALGDFERCLGWAWIELKASAKEA